MMPLTLAPDGEQNVIRRLGGTPEVRHHLETLGFLVGGTATVVSRTGGNLIVNVKEVRVALDEKLAQKIMI